MIETCLVSKKNKHILYLNKINTYVYIHMYLYIYHLFST
jgi:hypothetical protein